MDSAKKTSNKKFYGYIAMVGASIIGVVNMGIHSAFAIYMPYFGEAMDKSVGTIMYCVTIATLSAIVGSLIVGKLIEKFGVRPLLAFGTICVFLDKLLVALFPVYPMLVVGSTLAGLCIGIGTMATQSSLISSWFYEKRSKMMGIVLGITMSGGILMIFIASRTIMLFDSWRSSYLFMAFFLLIVGLGANLLLIRTPEKMGQKTLGWEQQEKDEAATRLAAQQSGGGAGQDSGITLKTCIKSASFWLIILSAIFGCALIEGVNSYGPTYYVLNGKSELFASNIAMVFAAAFFVWGTVSGYIAEKFGNRTLIIYLCVVLAIGGVMLFIWPNTMNTTFLIAAVLIFSVGAPFMNSLFPTISTKVFGSACFDQVTPLLMAGCNAGGALSAIFMNIIMAAFGDIKYYYIILSVGTFASMFLLLISLRIGPAERLRAKTGSCAIQEKATPVA